MVTKEQEEEFKKRKAAGPVVTDEEFKEFTSNSVRVKMTSKQYRDFIKSTDSKCNGDS